MLDERRSVLLAGKPVKRTVAQVALGLTFVIITGGIDLSAGSVYALAGEGSTTFKITGDAIFLRLGQGAFLGIGYPVYIAATLCLAGGVLLRRTRSGQSVFATGGAESSALLMGLQRTGL